MPGRHAGVPPTAAPAWPRNKGVPPCVGIDVAPNLCRAELKPPGATGIPGVAPPKRCTPGGSGVPPASVPGIRPAAGVAPPHRALPAAPSGPGVPGRHPGVRPAAQGVRPPAPSAPGVAPCSSTAFQQMHNAAINQCKSTLNVLHWDPPRVDRLWEGKIRLSLFSREGENPDVDVWSRCAWSPSGRAAAREARRATPPP